VNGCSTEKKLGTFNGREYKMSRDGGGEAWGGSNSTLRKEKRKEKTASGGDFQKD